MGLMKKEETENLSPPNVVRKHTLRLIYIIP